MYKFVGKPGKMYSLDLETTTMKLNYNCPDSEKVGSGPGSCGGNKGISDEKKFIIKTESTTNNKFMWKEIADKLLTKHDAEKYTQGLFGQSSDKVIANLKNKISEELSKNGYNGVKLEHNMDTDFNRTIDLNPNNKVPEIVHTKKEPIMEKNTVTFKPAKNIKEAESFLESLLDPKEVERVKKWNSGETAKTTPDKVQQIKLISFRGIDIKVANSINKQIAKNINLGLPRLKNVIATQMKKTPNTLMRISPSGSLHLNTIAIGNFERIEKQIDATRKLNGDTGKNAMKTIESNLFKLTEPQKKLYEDMKEIMKYSRGCVGYEENSTPERALESTINHEIAHTLKDKGKYAYGTPKYEEFRDAIKEMTKLTLNSDYKYKLSEYGCNPKGPFKMLDSEETFAELYSAYRFHEDENIHPDALVLLKKYLER